MQKIQITSPGIQKALRKYKYTQALAEYIWNGFDAKATNVCIEINSNGVGNITSIGISDNGYGISYVDLQKKFTPFFESEKEIDPARIKNTSAVHGKNGVGRLTFFTFAHMAIWNTVYHENGINYQYSLTVKRDTLNTYTSTSPLETNQPTGTKVIFKGIDGFTAYNFETDIKEYLIKEFGWFLELNKAKNYKIMIDGKMLDYSGIIGDQDTWVYQNHNLNAEIRYIQWSDSINDEYSRYYFIDSIDNEKHKQTTTLNNKGDRFYHSVFVKSSLFDNAYSYMADIGVTDEQPFLFTDLRRDEDYKNLLASVDQYLKNKRKPFLYTYTDKLIADFEKEDVFPKFNNENLWEKYRENELKEFIRELYQVEPKIFVSLNIEQKKIFVRFLNLIMDSSEKDRLLDILSEIVNLDSDERCELQDLLKTTTLSAIMKTIKLIEDRFKAISQLHDLVFNPKFYANEPKHIQKFVEKHYWIFGEQYHLVSAAEPKFEEALRRFTYYLRGEKKETLIDHPDKNKEMDIFIVRQLSRENIIHNIVVELKNPKIKLGEKELSQVKAYMRVIKSEPLFNASNMFWEFILIGNEFDTSGYLSGELDNQKSHGEKSLVYKVNNHKIFVKTWSEVFTEFELRHKFLLDKLEIQREKFIFEETNADAVISAIDKNSAIQSPEMVID